MIAAATDNLLEPLVKRARRLYTLPAVALQVVELTNQPTIDAKALKDCIENDPALTTKILRVVNSPLFGLSRQVTDLNQSLALLGTKPLKLLVLGFSLPKELLSDLPAEVLGRYWRKTVIKAVAARELADAHWNTTGDDAFIAGLLQDLGMLALIQDLGEHYIKFLDRVLNECDDLPAHERRTLGFDHATLTSRLLDEWGLPEAFVAAVAAPFDTTTLLALSETDQDLPQILHLADLFAEFLIQERPRLLNDLLDTAEAYGGLSIDEIEAIMSQLETKVPQLADILSLQLPNDTAYSAILLQAYSQISEVADDGTPEFQNAVADRFACEAEALRGAVEQLADHVDDTPRLRESMPAVARYTSQPATFSQAAGPPARWPDLLQLVEASFMECRQTRCALTLALLEVDESDGFLLRQGPQQASQTLRRLQARMESLIEHEGRVVQIDDYQFAVLLEDCERQPGVELARQMVASTRHWSGKNSGAISFSISAGLATLSVPSKNFPCHELIDAAQRCLNGVQLSGGDSVKSIDIY